MKLSAKFLKAHARRAKITCIRAVSKCRFESLKIARRRQKLRHFSSVSLRFAAYQCFLLSPPPRSCAQTRFRTKFRSRTPHKPRRCGKIEDECLSSSRFGASRKRSDSGFPASEARERTQPYAVTSRDDAEKSKLVLIIRPVFGASRSAQDSVFPPSEARRRTQPYAAQAETCGKIKSLILRPFRGEQKPLRFGFFASEAGVVSAVRRTSRAMRKNRR